MQRLAAPHLLAQVLATRAALLSVATPLGALAGGPLVAAAGPRGAVLACAVTTLVLGAAGALGTLALHRG